MQFRLYFPQAQGPFAIPQFLFPSPQIIIRVVRRVHRGKGDKTEGDKTEGNKTEGNKDWAPARDVGAIAAATTTAIALNLTCPFQIAQSFPNEKFRIFLHGFSKKM
jgi:hypothetical protein